MKREEIINLSAGKTTDSLIAEKILGWKPDTSEEGRFFDFWLTGANNQSNNKINLNNYKFSTDISVAWNLVEKLGIIIGIDPEKVGETDKWCATLDWQGYQESRYSAWANTPTLAICRTALLIAILE